MEAIVCHMRPSLEHLVQFHSFSICGETQFLIAVVKKPNYFFLILSDNKTCFMELVRLRQEYSFCNGDH